MNRAPCYDVPKHHTNLWRDHAARSSQAKTVGVKGDARVAGFSEAWQPELFHRLYSESPREVAAEQRSRASAVRERLHALASELPEFETLRKQTVRSPLWAGMAAGALAENVLTALPAHATDADKARSMLEGLRSLADATGQHERLAARIGEAAAASIAANLETEDAARALNETAVRVALRAGVAAAQKAIDDAQAALGAFGWGTSVCDAGAPVDPGLAIELARRVASSETLRRIVALAGRLTMTARAKRATRTEYARSEVVGVEPTGDVERLLPCELVSLTDPTMTSALYRRLLEKSALGYQLRGKEKEGRGPIVVLIDQSGSMRDGEGEKDVWAKAVALALLDTARAERRAFGVVLYNAGVASAELFPKPEDLDARKLLDLIARRPEGGTNYAPAFAQALSWIEGAGTFKRADIVHITDGDAPDALAASTRERAKAIGAHVYGIGIGGVGPALRAWSDDVAEIRDVSADAPAVDLIFDSI
ncbi:MAG TPA: VWA domain-containing protein [Polyangiaceae bacterium]|jgi:uncharacterized protein with von Willebrand factor type A (vWA) domain